MNRILLFLMLLISCKDKKESPIVSNAPILNKTPTCKYGEEQLTFERKMQEISEIAKKQLAKDPDNEFLEMISLAAPSEPCDFETFIDSDTFDDMIEEIDSEFVEAAQNPPIQPGTTPPEPPSSPDSSDKEVSAEKDDSATVNWISLAVVTGIFGMGRSTLEFLNGVGSDGKVFSSRNFLTNGTNILVGIAIMSTALYLLKNGVENQTALDLFTGLMVVDGIFTLVVAANYWKEFWNIYVTRKSGQVLPGELVGKESGVLVKDDHIKRLEWISKKSEAALAKLGIKLFGSDFAKTAERKIFGMPLDGFQRDFYAKMNSNPDLKKIPERITQLITELEKRPKDKRKLKKELAMQRDLLRQEYDYYVLEKVGGPAMAAKIQESKGAVGDALRNKDIVGYFKAQKSLLAERYNAAKAFDKAGNDPFKQRKIIGRTAGILSAGFLGLGIYNLVMAVKTVNASLAKSQEDENRKLFESIRDSARRLYIMKLQTQQSL